MHIFNPLVLKYSYVLNALFGAFGALQVAGFSILLLGQEEVLPENQRSRLFKDLSKHHS